MKQKVKRHRLLTREEAMATSKAEGFRGQRVKPREMETSNGGIGINLQFSIEE
jgi:hypothetical protein